MYRNVTIVALLALFGLCTCLPAFAEEGAVAPASTMEEVRLLSFGFDGDPDVIWTDVVLGIRDGKLEVARRESRCPSGSGFKDNSEHMDYIIDDTEHLPVAIDVTAGGHDYLVLGFRLAQLEEGVVIVQSLTAIDGEGRLIHWDKGTRGAPCSVTVTGTCNDTFCTTSCGVDLADCDKCDCGGIGFCTDGTAQWSCIDHSCAPNSCRFVESLCDCGCFGSGATGACCLQGECLEQMDAAVCEDMGGTFGGEGLPCAEVSCPPPYVTGACCVPLQDEIVCAQASEQECMDIGGTFHGVGEQCLGDNNGNGVDDACESAVPATSTVALLFLALVLIAGGAFVLARRPRRRANH